MTQMHIRTHVSRCLFPVNTAIADPIEILKPAASLHAASGAKRSGLRRSALLLGILLAVQPLSSASIADIWVFEPSASVDQRVDDNYRLDPINEQGVAATRAVASMNLSRDSQSSAIRGQARIDALLSINEDDTDERSSNQILFLETVLQRPRYKTGIGFSFKRDTPSRDISADITDLSQTAADTGASVTQDQNVERDRFVITPSIDYNISRRTNVALKYTYTDVQHGLPSVQDAIDRQVQAIIANENAPQEVRDSLAALDRPATINDIGQFTIDDELDDFTESLLELQFRHKLTRIDTWNMLLSYSSFEAQSEFPSPESEREEDPREQFILRNPRLPTTVDTARIAFGYERSFSTTFTLGGQLGYFTAESDTFGEIETNTGYTAAITARKLAGIDQFSGKFGVEVFPSDVGDVVESLELIGDYQRTLGPLLDFTLRLRAYEPDAISDAKNDDKFARRFFSAEPKLIWRFSRAWTAAFAYRYRRQKSQVDTISGESNALLFSLKYTPPSAISDARKAGTLPGL